MLIATGGFGRIFKITSNAHAGTGDGVAIAYRRGVPLMDMEFYQFHPTGLYKLGILLSEAARGEGGILRNNEGEAFAARYAPTLERPRAPGHGLAIHLSGSQGGPRNRRQGLCLARPDPPSAESVIDEKLPDVTDFARTYLGVEPKKEGVPIQPTAHYAMGGLPTNIEGQVLQNELGDVDSGALLCWRIRLRLSARRQSAWHQLAGRSGRLRSPGRAAHARVPQDSRAGSACRQSLSWLPTPKSPASSVAPRANRLPTSASGCR